MKRLSIILAGFLLSGCALFDLQGVWFNCPAGQVKRAASYGMFGWIGHGYRPSYCAVPKTFYCQHPSHPGAQCYFDEHMNTVELSQ
jgi:hypothetical protein